MTTISSAVAAQSLFTEEPAAPLRAPEHAHAPNVCEAYDASREVLPQVVAPAHEPGPTFSPAQLMRKSKTSKKDGSK